MSADESLGCGRRSRSRQPWVLAALAVAVLVLASIATPVAAHAYLSDSDPSNGEQVDTVPDEVTLTFSGDGVQVADATVTGPDGEDVSGEAEIDPDDSQLVHIPLDGPAGDEAAADGMYTVDWEILADDGHTVSGSFFFSVGDEPLDRDAVLEAHEDDGSPDEDASAIEAGAKGLLLAALVGLIGAPITAAVAVYPVVNRFGSTDSADSSTQSAVDRRLVRLLAVAGALLLVSVLALGLARATSIGPLSPDTLAQFVETPLGQAWVVQLGLTVILGLVLAGALVGLLPRRGWLAGTTIGAVLVGGTVSWTSHSATAIDRLQGTAVDFGHIGGAALWIGGLVVLALVVPPALREANPVDRTELAAATIRRYSLLALAGVTLAVATGLALAAWHVPSVSSLADSLYGVSLSAKTLLVLLALGLGGLTRFVLLRRLESPSDDAGRGVVGRLFGSGSDAQLREDGGQPNRPAATPETITIFVRAVRFEVAVLVLVLLVSGLLTSVPTAAVVGADDDELEMATIEREGPGDIDVELLVIPATEQDDDGSEDDTHLHVRPDEPLVFEVTFSSSTADDDSDRIESDGPVRLLATAEDGDTTIEVELEGTEDGSYATVQMLSEEGAWELRIDGAPNDEFVSEWYDVLVVGDGYGDEHDHDEGHDHDDEHDDHDRAHEDHDAGADSESPFTIALQFGAVAIGVIGSVAVAIEATRLRDRA